MSTNRKKIKTTTVRCKTATLAERLQGDGMVCDVGIPQNMMDLPPGAQANAVSTALNDKTTATRRKVASLAQMP
jgi:hypothetical protein